MKSMIAGPDNEAAILEPRLDDFCFKVCVAGADTKKSAANDKTSQF
jgi:hypothetical protein